MKKNFVCGLNNIEKILKWGGGGYHPHPPLSLYQSKEKTYYSEIPCKPQQ